MKMNTLTLLLALFVATSIFAQTVTTFSDGTPDDAIAIDSNGNIYCSNYIGDTIFKFTPTGEVSSFVMGLNTPNGLAFNSNEELYVCDGQQNTIYNTILMEIYWIRIQRYSILQELLNRF